MVIVILLLIIPINSGSSNIFNYIVAYYHTTITEKMQLKAPEKKAFQQFFCQLAIYACMYVLHINVLLLLLLHCMYFAHIYHATLL